MAVTVTAIAATRLYIVYTAVEAAGAAGAAVSQDVLGDLTVLGVTTGPLRDMLNNSGVAFAAQANARSAINNNGRVSVHTQACTLGAAATGPCILTVDPNVAGGGAVGNFRLDFLCVKQHANNTATFIVAIEYRHSIVR